MCFFFFHNDLLKYSPDELPGIGKLKMVVDPKQEYFLVKITAKSIMETLEVIR